MINKILILLSVNIVYIFCTNGYTTQEKIFTARYNELTHQVSLRINGIHFCGGTVLDEYSILTSATCIEGRLFNELAIVTGKSAAGDGDTYKSTFKITHSDYDKKTGNNNLAVIKLKTPIKFNEHVTAAYLPESFTVYGSNIVLAGWEWKSPDNLHYLKLQTLPLEACNVTLNSVKHTHYVTNKHICVNPCNETNTYTGNVTNVLLDGNQIVAIATWFSNNTITCNASSTPDLYTSIYMYKDWISQHLSRSIVTSRIKK